MKDLVLFPFHDLKKSLSYGFRNRDGHFMKELMNTYEGRILIVNRPTNILQRVLLKIPLFSNGEVINKGRRSRLIKVKENVYVLDVFSFDILSILLLHKKWFWKQYESNSFISTLKNALEYLNFKEESRSAIFWNLYCGKIAKNISFQSSLFDGFDNWMKIPEFSQYRQEIDLNYKLYSSFVDTWITNSKQNVTYYREKYDVDRVQHVPSGVDLTEFEGDFSPSKELINIPKPHIGFGGKISHLINTDIINYAIRKRKDYSFIFVGQIFNKEIYQKIEKGRNVFFLKDKKYEEYINLIKQFDVGIIPYLLPEKTQGIHSLKFLEYLAARCPVVSTPGNGVEQISSNVYIAENAEGFTNCLDKAIEQGWDSFIVPSDYSWKDKTKMLLKLMGI